MTNYCKCGCGTEIADDKTWVNWHNLKGDNNPGKNKTDITKEKISEANKGKKRTEECCKKQSIVMKKRYEDPEEHKKTSESLLGDKNPMKKPENREKHKKAVEKFRGGNDIVKHHIAYDFERPKELTVRVTRSFHGQIHNPKGQGLHHRGYSLID